MATITGTTFWFRLFGFHVAFRQGGMFAIIAFVALIVMGIIFPVWAIGHAFIIPKSVFRSLGRSKVRWIGSMIALFLLGDLSVLLLAVYYLVRIRPQLDEVQDWNDSERDRQALHT